MSAQSARQLHNRYLIQATWTAPMRSKLYELAKIEHAARVLEVGSGTGVITSDLARYPAEIHGIDIDPRVTTLAHELDPHTHYSVGDGLSLPFRNRTFDITLCHFLLLWALDPLQLLLEMARVTKRAGFVLALAEPDYGGRIDFPLELASLGEWQREALTAQGADPAIGRRLRSLFTQAGLDQTQVGVLGGEWKGGCDDDELQSEWQTFEWDVGGRLSVETLEHLKQVDSQAWREGSRILYVPTFYACGRMIS